MAGPTYPTGATIPAGSNPNAGQGMLVVGADPTSLAAALAVDATGKVLIGAGTAEIGRVALEHIDVSGSVMTRPANVTAYSVNDSVSDNATAGSVTALVVTLSDTNNDPVCLTEVLLASTDTGFGSNAIRIHLFNSDPTASTGVVGGDNAAWSNKQAGWVGSMSGLLRAFSDGCRGRLVPDEGSSIILLPATGARTIWWQLQSLGSPTPSANSTTFTPRFRGYQGRL